MPLLGKSSTPSSASPENRQLQASMIREAGEEQQNIDYTLQDLADAAETHDKSTKAAVNSQRVVDEAAENELNTANALSRASRNHDTAVSDEQAAGEDAKTNQQHEARLGESLAAKAGHLDALQQRKAQNDQLRESTRAQMHAQTAEVQPVHSGRDGHQEHGEAAPAAAEAIDVPGNGVASSA
ncbi:hypothetical protein TRAPUB_6904 [Trametes pubescens]|uniref:Uncharacterized protein n=1 Tax=Trametes pubescens TaxID=154538 RepID=A0A1M2V4N9_TRAPU|nr:hypothetical protein TRAPUB_6904 [Trametes pubescens]